MTSEQPTLSFDVPLTIRDKFTAFHIGNPHVADQLERLASRMIARGRKRIGINMLSEVLRYDYYMETTDANSEFRLCNSYRPHYARLLILRHPDWADIIETRSLTSAQ